MTAATRAGRVYLAAVVASSLILVSVFALRRGQDANWDQLNYHLAVPFLIWHGHFWDSVAPAGIQSYLNPLPLFPAFLLIEMLPPKLAALGIAVLQAPAFIVAGLICRRVADPQRQGGRQHLFAFAGFLLCCASPMALSESGTTYIDLITAGPVLLGWLLLLGGGIGRPERAVTAGLLLGAATGLKLTNAAFALATLGFILAGATSPRRRLAGAGWLVLGGIIGFVLTAGWWMLLLQRYFGSPLFPFFNDLLRSPDFPAIRLSDDRFLPHSLLDIVRYPWDWLVGGSSHLDLPSPASETNPLDARFFLIVAGTALVLAVRRRLPQPDLMLCWWFGFLVWLFVFAIHRYLIAAEIMAGAILLALVQAVPASSRHWALAVLVLLSLARMHVASWTRVPWGNGWQTIASQPPALPPNTVIFLQDAPTAYVALSLSADTRYVGHSIALDPTRPTRLTNQVARLIATAISAPYLLALTTDPDTDATWLRPFGLAIDGTCRPATIGPNQFRLCPLQRVR